MPTPKCGGRPNLWAAAVQQSGIAQINEAVARMDSITQQKPAATARSPAMNPSDLSPTTPPVETTPCLSVEGLGVAFGEKVVLAELDFALQPRTVTALMGPVGSGKSTLLRTLAGLNDANPRFRQWGHATYLDHPVAGLNRPRMVQQHARLMMASTLDALAEHRRADLGLSGSGLRDWCAEYVQAMGFPDLAGVLERPTMELAPVQLRAVAILREACTHPGLLMVDEPTAGLDDYSAYLLLNLLREVAQTSAVLLVLHSQRHARMAAQYMLLLAGGRIQETRRMEDFLLSPQSPAGQQFVRTGSCALPAPDADPATLADDAPIPPPLPPAALAAVAAANPHAMPASRGPSGFAWLVPGRLAGTPMPGVVNAIDHDLALLCQCGITTLITLTERDLPQEPLARHGLKNLHLPVRDREPPTVAQIQMLLKRMEVLFNRGEVLAVHCLAGLGRTGTVLAAWLVREGLTATEALRRVRLIDHQYVQSTEQEAFLQAYEDAILRKMI